jgi:hypothetical protein
VEANYNRRALRRGVILVWLLLALCAGSTSAALAEPIVSLEPAPDGTYVLVGSGWRPEAQLFVSVGPHVYSASVDPIGEFEVPTGLSALSGPFGPLSVHREERPTVAYAQLVVLPDAEQPHPFAVLFAQSIVMGAGLLGLGIAGLALVALAARPLWVRLGLTARRTAER